MWSINTTTEHQFTSHAASIFTNLIIILINVIWESPTDNNNGPICTWNGSKSRHDWKLRWTIAIVLVRIRVQMNFQFNASPALNRNCCRCFMLVLSIHVAPRYDYCGTETTMVAYACENSRDTSTVSIDFMVLYNFYFSLMFHYLLLITITHGTISIWNHRFPRTDSGSPIITAPKEKQIQLIYALLNVSWAKSFFTSISF